MSKSNFPTYGIIGLLLIALSWCLNWTLVGLRTHLGFFPLWLGYSIFMDAVVFYRKGTSLIHRSKFQYLFLFLISAPVWWLFEFFNIFTQNWFYDGREFFTDFQYFLLASLSFSTVIPAVFGTAELASTFNWIRKFKLNFTLKDTPKVLAIFWITGLTLLALIIALPKYFFPFLWIAIYFIIDPINVKLKNRTLFEFTSKADWRPIISLSIGILICAFFWEMWNYYSYPKWIYRIPHVNFFHIFEMPLLGYIGYPPFALELYAVYHLIIGIFKSNNNYITIN